MFIKKEKYKLMQHQIATLKNQIKDLENELDRLECSNLKWQDENKKMRDELNSEHLENHEQHRKLLYIEKRVKEPFGTIKDALDLKKDIKNVLSRT